jgi:hypothetical protein
MADAQPASPDPKLAYNPQTQQALRAEGEQWVPTKIARNAAGATLAYDGSAWMPVGEAPKAAPPAPKEQPLGVGQQIAEHAKQVASLNRQIDLLAPTRMLPADGKNKAQYDALRKQRDAAAQKAYDLLEKAKKSGAKLPDFAETLKQEAAALKKSAAPETAAQDGVPPKPKWWRDDVNGVWPPKSSLLGQTGAAARGAIAGALGAPGDIEWLARYPFALAAKHIPGLADHADAVGRTYLPTTSDIEKVLPGAGVARKHPGYQTAGELAGGVIAPGIPKGAQKAADATRSVGTRLLGAEAKRAVANVRNTALDHAEELASTEAKGAEQAGKRAQELSGLRSGIGANKVAGLEKQVKEAGAASEKAQGAATAAQTEAQTADEAAKALDTKLLEKPGISKEEFGKELESAVRDTNKKYTDIRARDSGYSKALESAGDELRVDTKPIGETIDHVLKDTRNPARRRLLDTLKRELITERGDVAHEGLSIPAADDLRKTLNDAIRDRIFNNEAVSQADLTALKAVRKQLVEAATGAWEPYKTALGKWSTLSRPLDFINKNPLLRKVVVSDPAAAEAEVTRAQIVGKLLTEASGAERKALGRLVAESPEIREAARLYFATDLFGPQGLRDMKSTTQMRAWLLKNKPALEQLGIFDEFKDMHAARKTAQLAVDKAAGVAKQTAEQAKAAAAREEAITAKLTKTQKSRAAAQGRVEKWRAGHLKTQKQKLQAAKDLGTFATRLDKARDNTETLSIARQFAKNLVDNGHIDDKAYGKMLDSINAAEAKAADTKDLRLRLRNAIGVAILSGGGSYALFRGYRAATGH